MAQAYVESGTTEEAVFSLFFRRLPERRHFLLACGLDTVLEHLENLHFEEDDLDYLASLNRFSDRFLDYLRDFRFSGNVRAVPEGTPVFANEPILEVTAPLPEAQIVETFIMNQIHVQTVLGSKAQRIVSAAAGRPVIDFGPRRMHGIDAALKAARAFHIAGVTATSNVLAGKLYQLPVTGTMAHSYIQAHEDEREAFLDFTRIYPGTVLLIDTYDTLEGARKVIELKRAHGEAFDISAVRLDSGDLLSLSREVRKMLDEAGMADVEIVASGGLDENKIARLVASGAPIDGFGIGTSMGISPDAPDLDIAYKLCEYAGTGCLKMSPGKPVLPGRKQVFRSGDDERDTGDVIARADESLPGRPLLETVMQHGQRLSTEYLSLDSARDRARREIARLPDTVRAIESIDPPYPVEVSPALSEYQEAIENRIREVSHERH